MVVLGLVAGFVVAAPTAAAPGSERTRETTTDRNDVDGGEDQLVRAHEAMDPLVVETGPGFTSTGERLRRTDRFGERDERGTDTGGHEGRMALPASTIVLLLICKAEAVNQYVYEAGPLPVPLVQHHTVTGYAGVNPNIHDALTEHVLSWPRAETVTDEPCGIGGGHAAVAIPLPYSKYTAIHDDLLDLEVTIMRGCASGQTSTVTVSTPKGDVDEVIRTAVPDDECESGVLDVSPHWSDESAYSASTDPAVVGLQRDSFTGRGLYPEALFSHKCTATFISSDWLVTAAHCFPDLTRVRFGHQMIPPGLEASTLPILESEALSPVPEGASGDLGLVRVDPAQVVALLGSAPERYPIAALPEGYAFSGGQMIRFRGFGAADVASDLELRIKKAYEATGACFPDTIEDDRRCLTDAPNCQGDSGSPLLGEHGHGAILTTGTGADCSNGGKFVDLWFHRCWLWETTGGTQSEVVFRNVDGEVVDLAGDPECTAARPWRVDRRCIPLATGAVERDYWTLRDWDAAGAGGSDGYEAQPVGITSTGKLLHYEGLPVNPSNLPCNPYLYEPTTWFATDLPATAEDYVSELEDGPDGRNWILQLNCVDGATIADALRPRGPSESVSGPRAWIRAAYADVQMDVCGTVFEGARFTLWDFLGDHEGVGNLGYVGVGDVEALLNTTRLRLECTGGRQHLSLRQRGVTLETHRSNAPCPGGAATTHLIQNATRVAMHLIQPCGGDGYVVSVAEPLSLVLTGVISQDTDLAAGPIAASLSNFDRLVGTSESLSGDPLSCTDGYADSSPIGLREAPADLITVENRAFVRAPLVSNKRAILRMSCEGAVLTVRLEAPAGWDHELGARKTRELVFDAGAGVPCVDAVFSFARPDAYWADDVDGRIDAMIGPGFASATGAVGLHRIATYTNAAGRCALGLMLQPEGTDAWVLAFGADTEPAACDASEPIVLNTTGWSAVSTYDAPAECADAWANSEDSFVDFVLEGEAVAMIANYTYPSCEVCPTLEDPEALCDEGSQVEPPDQVPNPEFQIDFDPTGIVTGPEYDPIGNQLLDEILTGAVVVLSTINGLLNVADWSAIIGQSGTPDPQQAFILDVTCEALGLC